MNMYVSNLNFQTTDDDLRNLFSQYGNVTSAKVINDRDTGRSRGFGFVEMDVVTEGREAMEKLNGKQIEGRAMNVSIAKEREERGKRTEFSGNKRW
ncbi:MAG: RNA-binding protein [Sphingobacteriales bacterium]|nr:MAG: RNA-binding protein [Sphingobacteriales bacterium]